MSVRISEFQGRYRRYRRLGNPPYAVQFMELDAALALSCLRFFCLAAYSGT
jgi:hypothetical protein